MAFKALKIRLYPTIEEKQMLDRHLEAYRFCYNLCLEYKIFMWRHYKINISGYDMEKELRVIRNNSDWLKKCNSECITRSAINVDDSFVKFFKGAGYPKFKKKKSLQKFSYRVCVSFVGDRLQILGKKIKAKTSKYYLSLLNSNKIKRTTICRDPCGNYSASILINTEINKNPIRQRAIGVDLGIKDLIITSDGIKYPNNRYRELTQFKIAKLQRKFSRAKKGSSNGNKLRIKIARLHQKAIRQREHYYHRITNELIRDNQTIVLESLKIKNMVKNKNLAKSINDASWGLIVELLQYKADWHDRQIIKLDMFYPSTKTCSNCGNIKEMPLNQRIYNCECGLSLDRDINAAINIRNAGLKIPGVLMEGVGYEPVEVRSN